MKTSITYNDRCFLVIKSNEQEKKNFNPFVLNKILKLKIGEDYHAKSLPNGSVMIETTRKDQVSELLQLEEINGIKVDVSLHRSLNYAKGVIKNKELAAIEAETIVAELSDQGVKEATVIFITKNEQRIRTNTIILTFTSSTIPEIVYAGHLRLKVEPYISSPQRCFKCQKFGHSSKTCRRKKACYKCGQDHEEDSCTNKLLCANCQGNHAANDKSCPTWVQEKGVIQLKIKEKISFPEARAIIKSSAAPSMSQQVRSFDSFSSVVIGKQIPRGVPDPRKHKATIMKEASTQTEVTECKCKPNFMEIQPTAKVSVDASTNTEINLTAVAEEDATARNTENGVEGRVEEEWECSSRPPRQARFPDTPSASSNKFIEESTPNPSVMNPSGIATSNKFSALGSVNKQADQTLNKNPQNKQQSSGGRARSMDKHSDKDRHRSNSNLKQII